MSDKYADLRELLTARKVAALGTLHEGAPFVSMVPFALTEDGTAFLIHVSELAAHTQDMMSDARVSLMVMRSESADTMPQELARVTVAGRAVEIPEPSAEYDLGKARYLARFPDSEPIFGFADFHLFAVRPASVRWVGGFAGAKTFAPEDFADAARSDRKG